MDIGLVVLVMEWFGGGSHTERRDYPSLALWKTGFPTGQFPPAPAGAGLSFKKEGEGAVDETRTGCGASCGDSKGREYK